MIEIFKESSVITIRNQKSINVVFVAQLDFHTTSADNTSFIMSNEGQVSSGTDFIITGQGKAFAVMHTGTAAVTGPAVVISTPGTFVTESKLAMVDPTLPGQLAYIDGCSNTNLVDPLRNGDPCINYLYFPGGITQTYHSHPSLRLGLVLSGIGTAWIMQHGKEVQVPLIAGQVFYLHRHCIHRFSTPSDSHMSIMVFHPDSEDGPRDEANPMKTRTYINP